MNDYSQDREQIALIAALGGAEYARQTGGTFWDIGAWSATTFSNTRALWELGWTGVMIEPSPGPMGGLLDVYGNDSRVTLIQAAVGIEPGIVKMQITDDAVSSSDAATYEKWRGTAKFRGSLHVPVITFEQIANQFGGAGFVSIDAEGISADLFHRMIALGIKPTCVCVEHDERVTELMTTATAAGYKCVLCNATNLVFAK